MTTFLTRKGCLSGVLMLLLSGGIAATGEGAGQSLTNPVSAVQYSDAVVIRLDGFDLMRQRYPQLRLEASMLGGGGVPATKRVFDLSQSWEQPSFILQKEPGSLCTGILVALRSGEEVLLRQLIVPETVASDPAVPTNALAAIEPGAYMGGTAPDIHLPDLARVATNRVGSPLRTEDSQALKRRVRCPTNYPMISAQNCAGLSRQTADPTNPDKRSLYVPLKSQLFDPQTGQPTTVAHYLCEVPLDTAWLSGTNDLRVVLTSSGIRVHASDKKYQGWKPYDITGEEDSGLGQINMAVDADGNLYYPNVPSLIVRFRVNGAEFEIPPVPVNDFLTRCLPPSNTLYGSGGPDPWRGRWSPPDVRYLASMNLSTPAHLFYMAVFQRVVDAGSWNGLHEWAGLFSIPVGSWTDAQAFSNSLSCLVGSWTNPPSFYGTLPQSNDNRRVSFSGAYGNTLYLTNYPGTEAGHWRVDVAADGTLESFGTAATMTNFNQGYGKPREVRPYNAQGSITWQNYGRLTMTRSQLYYCLTGTNSAAYTGTVEVVYDAQAYMQAYSNQFSNILASASGPSLAPAYLATPIPGEAGQLLGIGEYSSYYFSRYDLTTNTTPDVMKRNLELETGSPDVTLPLSARMGPYDYGWKADGGSNWLHLAGYTGLARLLFRESGQTAGFTMEQFDQQLAATPLDAAGYGPIKWFRYMEEGLDDRLFVTGLGEADRSGTAYSGGLMSYDSKRRNNVLWKLSYLSRCYNTSKLRSRLIRRSDGTPFQEFCISGSFNATYANAIPIEEVPANEESKIFFYAFETNAMKDLYGFSQASLNGTDDVDCVAYSPDRRYLVILQGNRFLTFDLQDKRFVDGAIPAADGTNNYGILGFSLPNYSLIQTPDNRLICYATTNANTATNAVFLEIGVSPQGRLSFVPCLAITATNAALMKETYDSVISFMPDTVHGDGSYDLFIGASPSASKKATACRLIEDFVPPRAFALSRRLTVLSTPAASVAVSGGRPGTTPYAATCTNGETVTLEAPLSAGGRDFVCWKDDDGNIVSGSTTCSVVLSEDRALFASYAYIRPAAPAGLTGEVHAVGAWSTNRTLTVRWPDADADDILVGYSYAFSATQGATAPETVMTTGTNATSPELADGSNWWFVVRAKDCWGNWGPCAELGPFLIDGTGPVFADWTRTPSDITIASPGSVHVAVNVADATSGLWTNVPEWACRLTGGDWGAYQPLTNDGAAWGFDLQLPWSELGGTAVYYRVACRDRAGNRSVSGEQGDFVNDSESLPYEESFEAYAPGYSMFADYGWTGDGQSAAAVSNGTYALPNGVGYPLGAASHTNILLVTGEACNRLSCPDSGVIYADFDGRFNYDLDVSRLTVDPDSHFSLAVNQDGHLLLWHANPETRATLWTEFPGTFIASGQWARVTVKADYSRADALYNYNYAQVTLNGVLLSNAAGYTTNNGTGAPGGTWFAIANTNANGLVNMTVTGGGGLDDLKIYEQPGVPFVDVRTESGTVTYDVAALAVSGTNSRHVVGRMAWTNSLTQGGGSITATTAWAISAVALNVGTNLITVSGTNAAGAAGSDSVTVIRGGVGTGVPFVDVTNAARTVTYDEAVIRVGGTNNLQVVGAMLWTNREGCAGGSVDAAAVWSVPEVALVVGPNVISVEGTNSFGETAVDAVTITRGDIGTGAPVVDVTNADGSVSYDVTTCSVGGSVNSHVSGSLWWSNALTGASGTWPAAGAWLLPPLSLGVGANTITVGGTNRLGVAASDQVTVTRGGLGTGAPLVDVTNAGATVSYDVLSMAVGGSNNLQVVGQMRWTNGLTGGGAFFEAGTAWSIPPVALAVGTNGITVIGTNLYGAEASDAVTVVRGGVGTGAPFLDVTNANAYVAYGADVFSIGGSNNIHLAGSLQWTNSRTGGQGVFASSTTAWPVQAVGLAAGENAITVSGTNAWGVAATDSVSVTRGPSNPELLTNSVPYAESFERYSRGFSILNVAGWSGDSQKPAVATNLTYALSGCTYPLETNHASVLKLDGSLTNRLSCPASSVIWTDFAGQFDQAPDVSGLAVKPDEHLSVAVNTNNHLVLWHANPVTRTNQWTEFTSTSILSGQWVRLTVVIDYAGVDTVHAGYKYARVLLNGAALTHAAGFTTNTGAGASGGAWFAVANTNGVPFGKLTLGGGGAVDDLVVTTGAVVFVGREKPFVDITNTNSVVSNDVTSHALGGTNNVHVIGLMWWTNSLTGSRGDFEAARSWSVTADLAVGTNVITVFGTNFLGVATNDVLLVTRADDKADPGSNTVQALRINCGGKAVGLWLGDRGCKQGRAVTNSVLAINPAGVPPGVYKTCRKGPQFRLLFKAVKNGNYEVRLHFAEQEFRKAGQRRFSVSINGQVVIANLDVVKRAGGWRRAWVRSVPVTVRKGKGLEIVGVGLNGAGAFINGIEVIPVAAKAADAKGVASSAGAEAGQGVTAAMPGARPRAWVSSQWGPGTGAANLLDGTDSEWVGAPGEAPWSVTLDFGRVLALERMDLLFADPAWTNWSAVGSGDLDRWFDLGACTSGPVAVRYLFLSLPADPERPDPPRLREIRWSE